MVLPDEIKQAAADGDEAAVQKWFSTGKRDPNERAEDGCTLLFAAVSRNRCDMIRALLAHGAGVDFPSKSGKTPLGIAADRGHSAAAALLLDNGADIDAQDDTDGDYPLTLAAMGERPGVIRLLLSRGADPNMERFCGRDAEAYCPPWAPDARALFAAVRVAGGWHAYARVPRKRLLALRVLCEQGRASTDDPLLRRLFPSSPPAPEGARVKRALEAALADQPIATVAALDAILDADALAASLERSLAEEGLLSRKRPRGALRARDGGRVPKEVFWLIFEYWRSDIDTDFRY